MQGSPPASQRPSARKSRWIASLFGSSRCVDEQIAPAAARGVPTGRPSHGLQGGLSGRLAAWRSPTLTETTRASERTRFEDLPGEHSHTLHTHPVHRQLGDPLTRHLIWVRLCSAAPFAAPAPGTPSARQWRRLRRLWRASNSAHSAASMENMQTHVFSLITTVVSAHTQLGRRPSAAGPLAPLEASSQRCWGRRSYPLSVRTRQNIAS